MAARLEILAGIAGTGKTFHVLGEYRDALRDAARRRQFGATLWLAPTYRAGRQTLAQLLEGSAGTCVAPNVMTFANFADAVLRTAAAEIASISPMVQRLLIREVIDELQREGKLPYFHAIAEKTGFVDLVSGFISELKRDESWPEHFESACRNRGQQQQDRELTAIYQHYQQKLLDLRLYDDEGLFWAARDALDQGAALPFPAPALIVVDGFTDFTRTQYEILRHLAERAERMLVTLPLEQPPARADLFARTSHVAEKLAELAGPRSRPVHRNFDEVHGSLPVGLAHLSRELFRNPREVTTVRDAAGVSVIEATGQLGEIEAVAFRVKRLLLDGVPAEDVVVAFRRTEPYAHLIHEIFTAAGIPYACDAHLVLLQKPVAKAWLSVLQLEQEDWLFDRLAGLIGSHYFRPNWPEWQGERTRSETLDVLRRLKLDGGRDVILRTLDYRSASAPTAGDALIEEATPKTDLEPAHLPAETTRRVLAFLQRLSQTTERLRQNTDFATWIGAVVSVARDLGIVPRRSHRPGPDAPPGMAELWDDDLRTWESIENLLFEAAHTFESLTDARERLTPSQFHARLTDLLDTPASSGSPFQPGCVRVLDAAQVRNLDVPYLFVAGLSESEFPRLTGDDCLYNESERHELNQHGLMLRHRAARSQDEMLLFYGVVTRARRELVLSYPALSNRGQPLFPSPYLTAVCELFEPGAVPLTHSGRLDPVPHREEVMRPSDLRLAGMEELRRGRPGLFRGMFAMPEFEHTARNILATVPLNVARFRTPGFSAYEGMLRVPRNLESLAERFGTERVFSATQLEHYAGCPYQFLLSTVLQIAAPETPETQTDHRLRGILLHHVLTRLHRDLAPLDLREELPSEEELLSRFGLLLDDAIGHRGEVSEFQEALLEIDKEILMRWGRNYAGQLKEYLNQLASWDDGPHPRLLEATFGEPPAEDSADENSQPPAASFDGITLGTGANATRVRGRIDRVDVGTHEGRSVFNVIDYKTGMQPKFTLADVEAGTSLQLAIYALAVQRLGLAGEGADPFQIGYWLIKAGGFQPGLKSTKAGNPLTPEILTELEAALNETVPRLAASLRSGEFPVYSPDDDCTRYCPYNTGCRVRQIRDLDESLQKRPAS